MVYGRPSPSGRRWAVEQAAETARLAATKARGVATQARDTDAAAADEAVRQTRDAEAAARDRFHRAEADAQSCQAENDQRGAPRSPITSRLRVEDLLYGQVRPRRPGDDRALPVIIDGVAVFKAG